MSVTVRRVVTGHDNNGRAKVAIDEIVKNVVSGTAGRACRGVLDDARLPRRQRRRRGTTRATRSTASRFPAAACSASSSTAPGRPPRNHRTDSLDYAVVMRGEIDMELDGGVFSAPQSGRRAGAAWDDSQLAEQRHGALPHRLRADRRQAGRERAAGCSTPWAEARRQ